MLPFLFAIQSRQTRLAGRSETRPDQGEENLNCKGVTGNGWV